MLQDFTDDDIGGLMPPGNNLSPERILTQIYVAIWRQ